MALSRCGINSAGIAEIEKGLNLNESMMELNLTGSEVSYVKLKTSEVYLLYSFILKYRNRYRFTE